MWGRRRWLLRGGGEISQHASERAHFIIRWRCRARRHFQIIWKWKCLFPVRFRRLNVSIAMWLLCCFYWYILILSAWTVLAHSITELLIKILSTFQTRTKRPKVTAGWTLVPHIQTIHWLIINVMIWILSRQIHDDLWWTDPYKCVCTHNNVW